jgi:predicted RND superfamily exporter protein
MLPEDSESAYYQRRMVKESDYQAEVLIFTEDSIEKARKVAKAAAKLDSISQVQTITDLFPPDAAARVVQARRIGMTVSGSAYLRKIMNLGEVVLNEGTVERIRSSVEKTTELIEDSQEAAFSGGHKNLVRKFEQILDRIDTLQEKLNDDTERARIRTENFVQTIMNAVHKSYDVLEGWKDADALTPDGLPSLYKDRFFAADGTVAVYAFPAKSVYDPDNLAKLMTEVTAVSENVTGFPTTHQVFSHMAVESFRRGTITATIVAIFWILLIVRRLRGFIVALLPLLMGGGWMLGILALIGTKFSYANIIALPLVMGLAVDYGVWYAHRRRERRDLAPWQVAMVAGRAILLAAGTTLAGLGAITLASYKGIASMGISVTIGLLCCVVTALLVSPAISELFFGRRK